MPNPNEMTPQPNAPRPAVPVAPTKVNDPRQPYRTAVDKITVTFIGDPTGKPDPAQPEYHGKAFPKGKAIVVDDANWIKDHEATLRRNNHFRVE